MLPIIGLALVIGLNVWATVGGGTLIQGGWVIPGSEEQQAADVLTDRFGPTETTMLLIFTDPDGDAASPAFQATVQGQPGRVADDPDRRARRHLRRCARAGPAVSKDGDLDPGRRLPEQGGRVGGRGFGPPGRCGGSRRPA